MKKTYLYVIFLILLVNISYAANLLSFTSNVFEGNGDPFSGDIIIEIYDSATGGSLIYNSTDDFLNNISSGRVDIMLGTSANGGTQALNLNYNNNYFINIILRNATATTDLSFNGLDRQEFTSPIGNITSEDISPANITSDLIADSAIDVASKIV